MRPCAPGLGTGLLLVRNLALFLIFIGGMALTGVRVYYLRSGARPSQSRSPRRTRIPAPGYGA
jgi:hypothetical protein